MAKYLNYRVWISMIFLRILLGVLLRKRSSSVCTMRQMKFYTLWRLMRGISVATDRNKPLWLLPPSIDSSPGKLQSQLLPARVWGATSYCLLLPTIPDNNTVTFFEHLQRWKNVIDKLCTDNCYFGMEHKHVKKGVFKLNAHEKLNSFGIQFIHSR